MEPTITAAIITGGVALASTIFTLWGKQIYDLWPMTSIGKRRKALVGTWRGTAVQEFDGNFVSMNLEITFTAGKKVIKGTGEFISPVTNLLTKIKFTGGFHHEQFAKLDYTNIDELTVQFGTIVMKLSSNGRTFEGSYVGYGAVTNKIVVGEVSLHRAA